MDAKSGAVKSTGSMVGIGAGLTVSGGLSNAGGGFGNTVQPEPIVTQRNQFLDGLMSTPNIGETAVSQFIPITNATTKGVDISFSLTDTTGIASLSLVRATVLDIAQGTVLQTWTASESAFTWSDTDAKLQQSGQAFYWIKLEPANPTGQEVVVGPQYILLNPSLLAPVPLLDVSASHAAASNGTVLVTVNVSGISVGDSVKIYVTNYEANPSPVAVAQHASAPLQFNLQATGETITIKAIAVSSGGAEASSGPTCTLVLNGTATVPAKIENITVTQLATGNQVEWPSSLEAGVTQYLLYRGQRGDPFSGATLLATIAATSVGAVIYLDTAGLTGDFQYFVIAVGGAGNSLPGGPVNPIVLYSSSQVPTNVPSNTINAATVDSIPVSGTATVRIYGAGGVGTTYTRQLGFGSVTRAAGSVTGLAFLTQYFIIFTPTGYLASTTYSDTLPDGYEWVGTIVTCPSSGSTAASCTPNYVTSGSAFHLTSITPGSPGYGYGTAVVVFSGGSGGTAPTATAQCLGGQVVSYAVTSPGTWTSLGGVVVNVGVPYNAGGAGNSGARYVLSS